MRTSFRRSRAAAVIAAAICAASCQRTSSTQAEAVTPPLAAPAPQSSFAPSVAFAEELPLDASSSPPAALTASDGTGLRLAKLSASAVVQDPLAFTEMHLTFENPLDRVLEGTFRIALPDGASVARFAMKIGDAWQEGEVVEKQRARAAYEDFLHRKQDPALMEKGAGNELTARVFPIPAHGVKELVVAYSQTLGDARPYTLPLRGLPVIDALDVTLSLGDGAVAQEMHTARIAPEADFRIDPKLERHAAGARSGNLLVARVRPIAESAPDPIASALILVDTSASRALGFEEELRAVERVVRGIAEANAKTPITVACFDQSVESIFEGEASAFGDREMQRMRDRGALGASDVAAALAWAGAHAKARLIAVTDGVATAGETDPKALAKVASALKSAGIERLDAIAVGGLRDAAALRALVTSGLPRDGVVAAADRSGVMRRLMQESRSGIAVAVEGATWSWPRTLDAMQPGDDALVFAELPAGAPAKIHVGDASFAPDLQTASPALLERAWAEAKIASYTQAEGASSDEARAQATALSLEHRVLSPYTALLVLETEQDYARFRIDRSALRDVMTIDDGRLALRHRVREPLPQKSAAASMPDLPAPRAPFAPPARQVPAQAPTAPWGRDDERTSARGNTWGDSISESFGAGGLGLSGTGEGGGGHGEAIGLGGVGTLGSGHAAAGGYGRVGGAHQTHAPSIRGGAVQVSGRMAPEVIQRIVRQNFGRLRLCYEQGLRQNPSLGGRVEVRFIVDRGGNVTSADASGFPDPSVSACVSRAFRNLAFPAPEGGNATITYPISFAPGDGTPPVPAEDPPKPPPKIEPYTGTFATVMTTLKQSPKDALRRAITWHGEAPGDVLSLVALGETLEATGDAPRAARAYGSIVDLFSTRADLRRFAGERLGHLANRAGLALAIDTYAKAAKDRPDHPSSHRLLAFALLKHGEYARAFEAIAAGIKQPYPDGRFAGVERILREDAGLIAAAWIHAEPSQRRAVLTRLAETGASLEVEPSVRFVLNWETDANDVDFHIFDDRGGHAYYGHRDLDTGGSLYADVTTGYGPECFMIPGPKKGVEYTLQANYYSRGPMGYGMGKVEIVDHDGHGGITFDERPFVTMVDHSFVDLGTLRR